MIEKGRISSFQMAIMMNQTILATALLIIPSITAAKAQSDMWLSPIWGASLGVLAVFLAYQLHKHYPEQTVIEYSGQIVGKILGKVIGFAYLFLYLHVNGIIFREYGEFIVGSFLHRTPISVVMGSMALVCAFSVRGGLETIARTAQHFVPIVIALWVTIVIFLIFDLKIENMFPMFENGLMPSIKGATTPGAWFSEYFLIAFMLPYINDREKGLKWANYSVLSVLIILFLTNLVALLIFGEITADLLYPVMNVAKYISIAEFFQHLESIVMSIWILGTFIKISVFYYVLALGTAQLLNLSEYKSLVFPLGFLLTCLAIWSAPNLTELKEFLGAGLVLYLVTMQIVLPAILLGITLVREKIKQGRAGAS
ncbi:endospore germination permease [Bacillus sp. DNRA2]|uniref:GerAB/ArcD/ProY family transporter n=1 Tax=Bacillus sp. DNRA2 TaxID=2723053 RepID=UPI001B7D0A2A|nr:endospore germination permease [Bacillus sp. DNRA2]